MVLTKKKGYAGTIRKIWNDDKTECFGMVGTFSDFMDRGIIENLTNYSSDTWICIPHPDRIDRWDGIGGTREEAIQKAVFGKNITNHI